MCANPVSEQKKMKFRKTFYRIFLSHTVEKSALAQIVAYGLCVDTMGEHTKFCTQFKFVLVPYAAEAQQGAANRISFAFFVPCSYHILYPIIHICALRKGINKKKKNKKTENNCLLNGKIFFFRQFFFTHCTSNFVWHSTVHLKRPNGNVLPVADTGHCFD